MADVKSENVYDVFIGRCFERKNAEGERTLEQLKADILDGNIAHEALFGAKWFRLTTTTRRLTMVVT